MRTILLASAVLAVSSAPAWLVGWSIPAMAQSSDSATPGYTVKEVPPGVSGPSSFGGRPGRVGRGGVSSPGGGGSGGAGTTGQMRQRFEQANSTHDGKLTLDQAQGAHLQAVARHFSDIDVAHKGYITMDDVRSYRRKMAAQRRAAQTDAGPPEGGPEPQ